MAALKQVLVTQLMAQDEGERLGRSAGSRLLRTTSLRTPVEHSSARTPSRAQDYTSGDTGFYECPEDYGECLTKKLCRLEEILACTESYIHVPRSSLNDKKKKEW